jgi:hypothetical protein
MYLRKRIAWLVAMKKISFTIDNLHVRLILEIGKKNSHKVLIKISKIAKLCYEML